MSVEMVLNELSHKMPASNIYVARQWLSGLRETIQAATALGVGKILRTGRLFYEIQLAPNYFVSNWLNDDGVDHVERVFLHTIATKYPYLQDILPTGSADDAMLSEFYCEAERADGFRYAYWMQAIAISFLSHKRWDRAVIENISVHALDVETGELKEQQSVSVNHASRPEHLDSHDNWITALIRDSIRDGHDIWYRREELYPNLLFCDALHKQLRSLHSSHTALRQVKQRLSELETFCANWQEGVFEPTQLRGGARQESQATLQQYGIERTFMCPDGEERVFNWHISINPSAWRLHFFPLHKERKIIIGYIGRHLLTATGS